MEDYMQITTDASYWDDYRNSNLGKLKDYVGDPIGLMVADLTPGQEWKGVISEVSTSMNIAFIDYISANDNVLTYDDGRLHLDAIDEIFIVVK